MKTDTLSDVLGTVHLRGAVFYDLGFGRGWAAEAPAIADIADAVFPGAGHVMEYHLISRGSGRAAILGEAPVRLQVGDTVVFLRGDAHVMSSTPGLQPTRMEPAWVNATRNDPKPIALVFSTLNAFAVGAPTSEAPKRVVCGFLGCDLRPFNPLVAAPPRLLHLQADDQDPWAIQVMQHAVKASQNRRPGANAVLERLSEMVFVNAVRRHAERLPEQSTGWLAGLRDRPIGRALALVHAQPEPPWTVDLLASENAPSRSAFCERFVRLVGQGAHALPGPVAHAGGGQPTAPEHCAGGLHRAGRGQRVRGRLHARVQAPGRRASCHPAAQPGRSNAVCMTGDLRFSPAA